MRTRVRAWPLPPGALLQRHRAAGAYTDCFVADLGASVSQADFVEAFYTTPVFRLERRVLACIGRRSNDAGARALACGEALEFAAWHVEARGERELLLCDFRGRTRSWLMSEPCGTAGTRLYFGSAVVPEPDLRGGRARLGLAFRLLLGVHRIYSRVLLAAAARRLRHASR